MDIQNILTALVYYGFKMPTVSGLTSWIASFISLFASIGVGVIVFTILLKVITFPLDFYSRSSMRKNSLKMEQMRPELEKLQKQYANDKEKYNQKMMALYKREGYSMFGACLPTILTLVFFIIVLTSFNNYSTYQNIKYLYNMNTSFNSVIDNGIEAVDNYIYKNDEGITIINDKDIFALKLEGQDSLIVNNTDNTVSLTANYIKTGESYTSVEYITTNGYIKFTKTMTQNEGIYTFIDGDKYVLENKLYANDTVKNEKGETFKTYFDSLEAGAIMSDEAELFILDAQQTASANKYKEDVESFLWIKNIWNTDSAFTHPVYDDYNSFNEKFKLSSYTSDVEQYANLTYKLSAEKSQTNGYFIMIILTAGSSLLLQLITSKGQKAQMELQSVDGKGAQTQKMMMWLMPIMMGVFAFMYTAAFSIYIIMSSFTSILSTVLINKIVDIKFKKDLEKKQRLESQKYRRR